MNDGGSARGRGLRRMVARRVALSGTSNTVERLVMAKGRGLDQSVLPLGRTRQL